MAEEKAPEATPEEQATPAPGQEAAPPEPVAEPDYKAELENLKAEKARLEQQYRSAQGILGQRLDIEAELKRLRRDNARTLEILKVVAEGQADVEQLPQKVAGIEARHQQEQAQETLKEQVVSAWSDIVEEVSDITGVDLTALPDEEKWNRGWQEMATRPELQSAYTVAYAAASKSDIEGLKRAVKMLKPLRKEAQRKTLEKEREQALAAARKEAEEAVQEKLRESGVLNMPGGKPAGGGGQRLVSHEEYRKMTPEQKRENYQAFMAWYQKNIGG